MGVSAQKRSLLSLTLLAFLVSTLLPFAAVYNPSAAAQSSVLGDRILICTIDGFKWVSLDELDGEQQGHDRSDQQAFECALCYISAYATKDFIAPAYEVVEHTSSHEQKLRFGLSGYKAQGRSAAYAYQSRAPPASA